MTLVRVDSRFGHESADNRLASWLLVCCVIGYAPVGLVGSLFDLTRELTSIPFRTIVLTISLYLISRSWTRATPMGVGLLLFFWSAYLLRLLWDWSTGVPKMGEAVVFFAGTVMLPSLAIGLVGVRAIDPRLTALRTFAIGSAFSALSVFSYHFEFGRVSEAIPQGGRLEFDTVNTISIGHAAVTTLIAALCLSTIYRSIASRAALLGLSAAALAALVLSGARGPAVALAGCLVAFAVMTRRWHWLPMIVVAAILAIQATELELIRRLHVLFDPGTDDASALERLALIRNAVAQFIENPLLGGPLLDPDYLSYPHNLFLEAAMAMGIVGLLLLLIILARAAIRAIVIVRRGDLFVPLLLLQYFIAAQFSGAIWGWSAMWAPLAAVASVQLHPYSRYRRQQPSTRVRLDARPVRCAPARP